MWEGHEDFLDFFKGNRSNENLIHALGDLGGNAFPTFRLSLLPHVRFLIRFIKLRVKVLQEKSNLILIHHFKKAFFEFLGEGLLVDPFVEIKKGF